MNTYQVLEGAEAIRKTIGMYIGSDDNPTQLAIEVLDNAFDEIASQRANIAKIYFDKENKSCWISDNGKGIDVYPMKLETTNEIKDSVEVLCTITHSGSKFENEEYDTHIGMHGVGLVVVNALSDWLVVKTRDRKDRDRCYEYIFQDFKLITKNETIEKDDASWSTVIGFKPSSTLFESDDIDIKSIVEKIILCNSKYEHARFFVNNKELPKKSFTDLVREQLCLNNTDKLFEVSELTYDNKGKPLSIKCYMTYNKSQDSIELSDVNLRMCTGKHLDQFKSLLKECISDKLPKKYINTDPKNLLLGLRLYITMTVPRAKFDGQIKNRMVLNVKDKLITPLKDSIEWVINQKGILQTILTNIDIKNKKNLIGESKNSKYKRIEGTKLKDCINTPGDVLYIVEGDSAGGIVDQVRNKYTEAYFPARGKILNVEKATLEKIENNNEIQQLKKALGPINNRRYEWIKLMADSDPDGYHINVLFILVLTKIAYDYFERGRVSVVIPPLYGAKKGNKFIPIYDHAETDQYRKNGYDITRYKGLGEFSPEELQIAIESKHEWIVKLPDTKKEYDTLMSIITDTELKKLLLSDNRCSFENVLRKVRESNEIN